ncbi:Vacuolar protein sorting-associated protein 13 [Entamoeba marina]
MFEELVADILTRTLGKYIVELNGKSINISIWNGKVELYNLTTKPDIFESLNLPLIITKSCVKELTIVIPWKSLTTLPFQITLRGVHIDITPKTTFFYNEKDAVELAARERKDALDRFEMIQQLSDSKSGDYQSMWSSIAKKVSENLEVVIEDVGITYNGNINEGNITLHLDNGCIKKKCVLNKFEMIITDENKDERVLTIPMLEFDIIINKNTGKTTLNGLVEQILFCITKPQYNKILSVIERITKYTQTMKYLYCRPSSSVHDSPQEWWKFVFIATRDYLRTRDEERNPVRVDLCSQLRERYIELFRHVHKAPWTSEATEDEQHEFDLIEEKLRIAELKKKSVYESSRGWFGFGYTNPKLPDDLIDKIYSQTDLTESLIQDNDVVFDGSFKIQSLDLKLLDGKSSLCAGCVNDINIGFEARGVGTCLTLNIDDIKLIEEVEGIGALWQKKTTEKLLNLKIEESPIDRTYDLSILCDVSESVIHISNGYLQKVVNFLEPPTEMDFSRVKQFAEYQLQQLYSSVASQLDIFSSDPKKIELGIHIIAPIIYVHYDADVRGMDNNVAKITLGTLDISDDVFDKEHRVFKTQINNISLKLLENVRDETDSNKNIVVYPTSLLINLSLNNSSTATPKFRVICSVDPFVARLSKRKFDMILAYVFLLTSLFTSDVSFNDFQSQSNTILSSADSIQTIKKFYSTSSDEGVVNDEIIETVDDHSTTDHKTNDTNTNEDIDKSNSFESVNASLLQEFIQKRSDSTTFEIIINMDVFEVLLSQVDDLDEETIMTSVKLQKGKVLFESKPSSFSCDFTLGSLVMDNGFNSTIPYLAMSDTHSDILQQYIHDEPTLQTNPFLHCKVDVVDTSVHVVVDIDSLTIIYEPHVISEIISFMMSLALFPETEEPSETVYFYDVTVNLTKTFVLLQSTTEILSVSSLNGIAITVRMDDIVMDVDFLIKTMEMKNIKYLPSQPQYQSITSTNNNFLSIRYITGSSNDVFEIHVGEMTCNFIVQEFFDSFAIAYDDRVQKAIDLTSVRQRVEQQYEYLKKTITTTLLETPSGKATTNISLQSPTITIFTSSGQTMFYIKSLSIHDGSNGWEMLFEQMKIKTTINQFTDHFMSDFTFTLRIPITQSKTTEIEIELPCSDLSMSPHQFKLITDVFKAFFSDPQQEVPPIVNEECHSIEELPIPSNELSVRLILAIKQLNVSLKADHITHSSSVSSVLLRNLQGFVNFTTNSYALFYYWY